MAVPQGREDKRQKKEGTVCRCLLSELREPDSNQRPLGYEPNELPTAPPRDVFRGAKIVHLYTFCNTTIVKYCYFMQNPIIPQDNLHRYSCYSK